MEPGAVHGFQEQDKRRSNIKGTLCCFVGFSSLSGLLGLIFLG